MALSVGISEFAQAGGAASVVTTTAASTTTGSTLVAFTWYDNTFTSVTDSASNSWTQRGSTLTSGGVSMRCYVAEDITSSGSHTVSANFSTTGSCTIAVVEVVGAHLTSAYDQANGQVDATEPWTSGGITTTSADEMLVAAYGAWTTTGAVNATDGGSFTRLDQGNGSATLYGGASFYRIVSSTGSYDVSISDTGGETTGGIILVSIIAEPPPPAGILVAWLTA